MPEVVPCPTCGGPARTNPAGEPLLLVVTDEDRTGKIAQLTEVVRRQKERLEAADQRILDLEEILRQSTNRPGVHPPVPPVRPAVRPGPFQGKAERF